LNIETDQTKNHRVVVVLRFNNQSIYYSLNHLFTYHLITQLFSSVS